MTWTRISPESFTTAYAGRVWELVKITGGDSGLRPGWYLRAADSPSTLTAGEWAGPRIINAQYRAISMILTDQVRQQAAAMQRMKALAEQLDKDAAEDDANRNERIAELVDETGDWSSKDPDVARLAALVDVQREIAQTIRIALGEVDRP
ncbi:hypothetical protein GCM10023196_037600 [Actinoallomurus vinaceus]|uniref:Uncharacterized protein n=1 Tax=Actinoallomurus vinaceus TaxID=1080074 RepID=A0ABP8U9F6_9ACTN